MNSFGHAIVASWEREEPRFMLGAMLPDLGMLIGARLRTPDDQVLSAGVRQHHVVDDLFHALPAFRSWWRASASELIDAGLRRHSARAASHVAIELLLDGQLALSGDHESCFLAALGEAERIPEPAWRAEPTRSWPELVERLVSAGVPHHLRDPVAVARRVEGALARRPRLRLAGDEAAELTRWLAGCACDAPLRSAIVLDQLRTSLS